MIVYTRRYKIPFQVDDADYEAVSYYTWSINNQGYVITNIGKGKYPGQRQRTLYQFLLGKAVNGLTWDHINRDKLDNRRQNLRMVSRRAQERNKGARKDNPSGIRGVSWKRDAQRWYVKIRVDALRVHVGSFQTLPEAIAARTAAEEVYW